MHKKIISLFILGLVAMTIGSAANAETTSVTVANNNATTVDIYKYSFDQLVMDFNIKRSDSKTDLLKALTVKNLGTARDTRDISKVVFWADNGKAGFQGMGIDYKLGEGVWSENNSYWYLTNLNYAIAADGGRFFVSIETPTSISSNVSVQMEVPALTDVGTVGQFDIGDSGIFLALATGPATAIINSTNQTIRSYTGDIVGPKSLVTDPANWAGITTNSYKIKGTAKDQGGSTPASVKIAFNNGPWQDVTPTGANYETWEYNWLITSDGSYTIKTMSEDWLGNKETNNEGIEVTVKTASTTSSTTTTTTSTPVTTTVNSSVAADKSVLLASDNLIPANGTAKAYITIAVRNSNNEPLKDKTVVLTSSNSQDVIVANSLVTDVNGRAAFTVLSKNVGKSIFSATADSVKISQTVNIEFTKANFVAGDLIKASGLAVYYYGADGKRYVFPNEKTFKTWYTNFDSVKKISDAELMTIGIGGNVTYRPGLKMVKIDTDPRVYAVDSKGLLRWINSETLAKSLYGDNWNKQIDDVPEVFFINYQMGSPITATSDFNVTSILNAAKDINSDKKLSSY